MLVGQNILMTLPSPYILVILSSIVVGLSACRGVNPEELTQQALPDEVDYNFHIRPLLSDRCYKCHGPDNNTRETEWRLDREDAAFGPLTEGGGRAIIPGNLNRSVLWQRINSDDPELVMPPPASHLVLSNYEKALIGKWIESGAAWKNHWAFEPPSPPVVPPVNGTVQNAIDAFILEKIGEQGLEPSEEADPERLLRRVTMDLTGLPPSMEEMDHFLKDHSPNAYEKVVDRLLETDAHAERLTMEWLDVARYADSHGVHADGLRIMWPWRDWVIDAFKRNMSYDQFVTWQIAGDLLPDASREQKLATGFHRNHVANSESGIVPEEFRLQYVADRTNTTATAFMGLTTECSSCHDHKFDPISQREFYEMSAFFNQVDELGMIGNDKNWGPIVLLPDEKTEREIAEISEQMQRVEESILEHRVEEEDLRQFIDDLNVDEVKAPHPDAYFAMDGLRKSSNKKRWVIDGNKNATVSGEPELVQGKIRRAIRIDNDYELIYLAGTKSVDADRPFSAGAWINVDEHGSFQSMMGNIGGKNDGWRGWIFYLDSIGRPGLRLVHRLPHNYIHIVANDPIAAQEWQHLFFTYDGTAQSEGLKIFLNGVEIPVTVHFDHLYKNILPVKTRNYVPDYNRPIRMGKGSQYLFSEKDDGAFVGAVDQVRIYDCYLTPLEVHAVYGTDIQQKNKTEFSDASYRLHYDHRINELYQKSLDIWFKLNNQKFDLLDPIMESMVLAEREIPRKTHVLIRGQYDRLGEEVSAGTPAFLLPFPKEYPKNRLGLAKWLFHPKHPLTARVAVNRYWQLIFGRGIVETVHDFGSQGSLPTHPELLDYLALTFQESGWDLRALLKMMVMSATYRQSSQADSMAIARDPKNLYLARGPNYRWSAEIIRDNALAASGLLNQKVGGESVRPYQPPDLWKEKNEFSGYLTVYEPDTGQDLYRRSMYTFIRRTAPPPAMIAFDATNRAVCTVKRERTNTPLQALILMNDPQFVEAARVLAERMQMEGGTSLSDQIKYAFRKICGRKPTTTELDILKDQFKSERQNFQLFPEAADSLLSVGNHQRNYTFDKIETAALAMVNNSIMNFDEAYMKR